MLSKIEEDTLIKKIPKECHSEERRAAYSVIAARRQDWTMKQACGYYSISEEHADRWWNYFNFSEDAKSPSGKRGRKTKDIMRYLKENIGKTITPKDLTDSLEISLPTFYNFYNANRSYFKKVKRGQFEIIDPNQERKLAK
jgi:hypothetical protein